MIELGKASLRQKLLFPASNIRARVTTSNEGEEEEEEEEVVVHKESEERRQINKQARDPLPQRQLAVHAHSPPRWGKDLSVEREKNEWRRGFVG
ncbi:hypothetical protein niasHS_002289 [Heterodera schachtii]|uniref:Uncharacterized protein n=2 Tax=Heterodera TaxID=34509 RepID=A0ABD2KJZ5_HETSC